MNPETTNLVLQSLIAGERLDARQTLSACIRKDPKDEIAWMLLVLCLDLPDHKRFCIEKVLQINSENLSARKALYSIISSDLGSSPDYREQPVKEPGSSLLPSAEIEKEFPAQPLPVQKPAPLEVGCSINQMQWQAIEEIKNGNKPQAQRILTEILRQNPRRHAAWLLLADCLDDDNQKQTCLERAAWLQAGVEETGDLDFLDDVSSDSLIKEPVLKVISPPISINPTSPDRQTSGGTALTGMPAQTAVQVSPITPGQVVGGQPIQQAVKPKKTPLPFIRMILGMLGGFFLSALATPVGMIAIGLVVLIKKKDRPGKFLGLGVTLGAVVAFLVLLVLIFIVV